MHMNLEVPCAPLMAAIVSSVFTEETWKTQSKVPRGNVANEGFRGNSRTRKEKPKAFLHKRKQRKETIKKGD